MHRLHRLEALTLVATKPTGAADAATWEDRTATDLENVGGGLFRLDPPAPPGRPGAGYSHVMAVPEDARAPRSSTQADIRTDRWLRHGATVTPQPEADVSALIVAEVLTTDPARLDEWDEWYDAVHLPDMMECGAFAGGTRWHRADPREGSANHLTIYEIAGVDLSDAVSISAAIMPGLIEAGRKHTCHAGGLTMALTRA